MSSFHLNHVLCIPIFQNLYAIAISVYLLQKNFLFSYQSNGKWHDSHSVQNLRLGPAPPSLRPSTVQRFVPLVGLQICLDALLRMAESHTSTICCIVSVSVLHFTQSSAYLHFPFYVHFNNHPVPCISPEVCWKYDNVPTMANLGLRTG